MDWTAISAVADLVAAVGVIITLVYLTVQIRENTRATKTASRYEITRDFREVATILLDEQNGETYRCGLRDYPDHMEAASKQRFNHLMSVEALTFQGIFAQYEKGQLEDETYQAYLLYFSSVVSTPGAESWWNEVARDVYVPSMVAAVDERKEQGDLVDVLSWASYR